MAITSFTQVTPLQGNDTETEVARLLEAMVRIDPQLKREFFSLMDSGYAVTSDTRLGSKSFAIPDDGYLVIRMPESLNPQAPQLTAADESIPDLTDFVGYEVRVYRIENQIVVQPLGYIYED